MNFVQNSRKGASLSFSRRSWRVARSSNRRHEVSMENRWRDIIFGNMDRPFSLLHSWLTDSFFDTKTPAKTIHPMKRRISSKFVCTQSSAFRIRPSWFVWFATEESISCVKNCRNMSLGVEYVLRWTRILSHYVGSSCSSNRPWWFFGPLYLIIPRFHWILVRHQHIR